MFRQYVQSGEVNPAVIVDDSSRTGEALKETATLVREMGTRVIGCGVIVRFNSSPDRIQIPDGGPSPVLSLANFDAKSYDTADASAECKKGAAEEPVRF